MKSFFGNAFKRWRRKSKPRIRHNPGLCDFMQWQCTGPEGILKTYGETAEKAYSEWELYQAIVDSAR